MSSAVSDIAEAASLDITKIKLRLLDRWLPARSRGDYGSMESADLNETVSIARLKKKGRGDPSADDDLLSFVRCVHLAQDGGAPIINYLVAFGFSDDSTVSIACKLRALRVLLSVSDGQATLAATGTCPDTVERRLRHLHFAARMERLNLPVHLASLEDEDDGGLSLVDTVLRTSGHLTEGVELASELCLHLGIRSPAIWSSILKGMVRLDLEAQLVALLLELNQHPYVSLKLFCCKCNFCFQMYFNLVCNF